MEGRTHEHEWFLSVLHPLLSYYYYSVLIPLYYFMPSYGKGSTSLYPYLVHLLPLYSVFLLFYIYHSVLIPIQTYLSLYPIKEQVYFCIILFQYMYSLYKTFYIQFSALISLQAYLSLYLVIEQINFLTTISSTCTPYVHHILAILHLLFLF